ncbi:MAG: carboxylesterase family protein, partial [Bacteroidia bacterium]|nr:carboxylesterase family protein [Bacteroidia bacterium]
MRNMLKLSVAFMILAAAVSCSKEPAVVAVDGGLVQGVASAARGITVFKGIPYAAPPVDSLRWREPQPVIPWEGVKKADTFGRIPWQEDLSAMDLYGKEFYSDGMPEMSEDCLYLNIWAPTKTVADPQAKLPVALWIHGGAFYHGFSNEITFDGDEWAGRGVILVTINYREGVFGFLAHDLLAAEPGAEGRSGNYALYDQLAALEWVNRNIASFGGDPENVTVFGQSAGARSVQTLVSNPNMTGSLISKAIIQSGGGISTSQQTSSVSYVQAREAGAEFCEFAGYETLEQMKAAPAEEIMQKYIDYQAQGKKIPLGPMSDFNLVGNSFTSATALNQILQSSPIFTSPT